ncbi:MAG TPA: tetratricopeptide repeat protein [Lacunisphaera sp.]|nr:tetratricopeptide repeat protein [Lacunisphaera sp.]
MKVRRTTWLAGLALVLATIAAYANSIRAPFVFDDLPSVVENPTIRSIAGAWQPPRNGSSAMGRPLLNLSFALNYAAGGLDPRGYHAVNLLLHVLATLAWWGVLRRTLRLLGRRGQATPENETGREASISPSTGQTELLSFVAALLWAVHPLLTESVVSIAQRSELLGSLWFLLTVYGFIRASETSPTGRGWALLSVAACLLGVFSKEIIATVPVVIFLYDRTFVAGSFGEAWRRRKGLHVALAATWLPLAWLMAREAGRGGTVGFFAGSSAWRYLLTQCEALAIYLKLALWPHPLVIDYGVELAQGLAEVWWQALLILVLLAGTTVALCGRRRGPGFVGAWCFLILAPSSSFVPLVTQPIAEHRMYLPLAGLMALGAGAVAARWGRRGLLALLAAAAALGGLTWQRTLDYRSELSLWQETIAQRPNARAVASLGTVHFKQGNLAEAVRLYGESIRMNPNLARTHYNLGLAQEKLERSEEAAASFARVLALQPGYPDAHLELGRVLTDLGRLDEAERNLRIAVAAAPDSPEAFHSLATLRERQGRTPEAIAALERVLALAPGEPAVHYNHALLLASAGRSDEAIREYRTVLEMDPRHALAHMNLGVLLARSGRLDEGIGLLRAAVDLDPRRPDARANLGLALVLARRPAEAVPVYSEALRLQPDSALAHLGLGNALFQLGRPAEARRHYEEALRLRPDLIAARQMLDRLAEMP